MCRTGSGSSSQPPSWVLGSSWPEALVRDTAGLLPGSSGGALLITPQPGDAPQDSSSLSPFFLAQDLWSSQVGELPWALSDSPGSQANGMGPQGNLRVSSSPLQ